MASNHYGSLGPVQQYNQLAFSVIPQSPHPQHPQHPQHQHQPQLCQHHPHQQPLQQAPHHQQPHQPTPTTAVPPPTFQQHTPVLPPTNNGVAQQQQQQGINPNTTTTQQPPSTPAPAPAPAAETTPSNNPTPDEPQRKRRRVGRPPKSQATRDYLDQRSSSSAPLAPPAPQPPQVHTPHPLSKGPYNTAEDAVFSLQLHVFSTGYGVSQKRTVKEKLPSGRYDPGGDVIRRDFACDRGGSEFVSQSTGERRRESKKCGCPWKAVARRLKREGDRWFVEVLDARHNHPVTPPELMHTIASYRRWQRDNNAGIRSAIERLTRAAAMPARQVADYLKGVFADPDLDRIDKNILRALSMSDVEMPSDAAGQGSVVFEVVGRRPTIILQETPAVPAESGGNVGTLGARRSGVGGIVGTSVIRF
ncbi:uncharacterized protein F4807DRAFT_447191 [Annulohypoxylon truncatum]|uniref:uncharacterized protein n=1 Tax=Annulohypoxylon truncatum TaxID=327061 RepID=UPI002007E05D|nr:uncharacterized protein F4807DRAFT_447191 [Annulohypoxylon truncatum]KAI1204436.1 hypothetical protein F4807DRAFT_447191 [Annulohypoxylon truncatum]